MAMVNQSKPSDSITNNTKVSTGETWASITTTWASETHTWLGLGSFISNNTKVSSSITNISKPV